MTDYVLIISIGPVQGFIAAARRSRDLWSGSWLLSEMAKACAYSLYQQKAELIFPAPTNPHQALQANSDLSVGNKIQVVLTANTEQEVKKIAQSAKEAAQKRFVEVALQAKKELSASALRDSIWNTQIDDYVEAQAAWVAITQERDYATACDLASSVLAARKATRDFLPSAISATDPAFMLPKSSLDGARETVLQEDKLGNTARLKLGLSESEQLDCAGVVKRLGLKNQAEQFTPFSRVTAHSWLKDISDDELKALREAYEPLIGLELATRVSGNDGLYKKLPFDAQFCYSFRLESAIRDNKKESNCSEALQQLLNALKPLWRKYGHPCPYGVLLLADGDNMGKLLDTAKSKETHQTITQALSAFAESVRKTVQEHEGHAIYAGGDDVLAFVPLSTAQKCAKALSVSFNDALKAVAKKLNATTPTLSVGLGISHIMEPLGNIRELAKQAEKVAKGDTYAKDKQRNALGISLDVRSGSTTDLRIRWDDEDALNAFKHWIDAYRSKTIPSRIAYDTRNVHTRTKFALTGIPELGIPQAEFSRMLEHARTQGGEKLTKENRERLEQRANELGFNKLDQLSNELIIARWFAAKTARDINN